MSLGTATLATGSKDGQKPSDRDIIYDAVVAAVEQAKDEKHVALEATALLEADALADPDLYNAITQDALHELCSAIVSKHLRLYHNATIWRGMWDKPEERLKVTKDLKTNARQLLLDWVLPGGCALRNATHVELKHAINAYTKQGVDLMKKGALCEVILEHLPPRKKVGTVMTEDQILGYKSQIELEMQ